MNKAKSLTHAVGLLAFLYLCVVGEAANFTTAVQQGTTARWDAAVWNPGAVTPTAGNTYECVAGGGPTRIRNPNSGSSPSDPVIGVKTFPGDSLQLDASTEIRAKGGGNTIDFPGVSGNPGLILNGGNLDTGDNGVFGLTGVVLVQSNSSFSCGDTGGNNSRGWQVGAQIRGSANLTVVKTFGGGIPAVEVTSADNPFSGKWIVTSGGLKGTGSGSLGSGSITMSPTNAALNPANLEVNYDLTSPGTLTLTNGGGMILHQVCSFTDVVIEGNHLSSGLHTYAELNGTYPANFPAGGSGSISVQPPAPPSTPTNIIVVNGDSQVTLSWSQAANAESYFVKRSLTSGSGYTVVGTPTGTSFTDVGLANGATYYYVISATNALAESANSVEVIGRPNIPVTGLTAVGGTGQVALAWNALPGATSYRVQRSITAGGPYTVVNASVPGTTYTDATAQGGRNYFYTVVANLAGGLESGVSNEAFGTTAPGAPNATNATLFASTVLRLGWAFTDPVVSQFNVESSTDNVNFTPLATVAANERSYTNSGLALNTTYFYRVQAQNATGLSAYSAVISNTTPTFGINVNFALATAPNPPGYVQDSGQPYGDRGNGYTYGWDRDITADARQRNAANSPDLRYDTFVHMIKATPPAVWNIAIPSGFYKVHIVAGDPSNTDSVFQFDVEGTLTPTVTPGGVGSVNSFWGDFVVTCGVSDGQLTIKSGPDSQTTANNNKISFIDIYPDIPVPPIIGSQPQSQTVEESRPVSFAVTMTQGSDPLVYQWYFDDLPLQDATNQVLTFPHIHQADAGNYFVIVTNYGGAATSAVATLTVTADTIKPYIVSAASLDGRSIGVCFNEEMDNSQNAVTEAGNYQINDGTGAFILNATLRPDGRSVNLILSEPLTSPFTLTIFSQRDLAGNLADALQTNLTVLGFTTGDIGGPAFAGSHFSCDGDTIEVVGGGVDFWGNADQAYLITKTNSGDFDVQVRVNSLIGSNAITKALLVARESLNADSRGVHVSLNPPPPGRNQVEMGLRSTTGGATAAVGASFVPAGVPNAWMRIKRAGDIFTGYRSTNGVDWIQLGQTNVSFPADMVVGLGVTAHDTNLLATGMLSGFRTSAPVSQAPIINPSYSTGGGFSGAIQTQNGVTYAIQYKDDLAAPTWSTLSTFPGNGSVKTFSDPTPGVPMRFYRIVIP